MGIVVIAIALTAVAGWFILRGPTQVPPLRSLPVQAATAALSSAGLRVGTTGKDATTAVGPQTVMTQSPPASTWVLRWSSVDMTIAVTPVHATVPAVTGTDLATAEKTLNQAPFLPQVMPIFETSAPVQSVTQQLPRAGTPWTTGRPVVFTVVTGPDDGTGVAVPDLKGNSLEQARAALDKVGLSAAAFVGDTVTPQYNSATGQFPAAGTRVPRETVVLLLFTTQ